jgi:tRNA (guanine-N7-)-methyltransferase
MVNLTSHLQKTSRLYGRRKGRPLRVRKAQLMRELLPALEIKLPEKGPLDVGKLFVASPTSIWLEIGFGGGEHLALQAEKNPTDGFIGCEPFVNGVASLLDHIDQKQLRNVRIFPNDARIMLDVLPEASVARCFILFPDPWPKARHAERRFVCAENMPRLARVLRKGAELRLATDVAPLAEWMRDCMAGAKEFDLVEDATTRPADWMPTRYEAKGIRAGRKPVYLKYIRNSK